MKNVKVTEKKTFNEDKEDNIFTTKSWFSSVDWNRRLQYINLKFASVCYLHMYPVLVLPKYFTTISVFFSP